MPGRQFCRHQVANLGPGPLIGRPGGGSGPDPGISHRSWAQPAVKRVKSVSCGSGSAGPGSGSDQRRQLRKIRVCHWQLWGRQSENWDLCSTKRRGAARMNQLSSSALDLWDREREGVRLGGIIVSSGPILTSNCLISDLWRPGLATGGRGQQPEWEQGEEWGLRPESEDWDETRPRGLTPGDQWCRGRRPCTRGQASGQHKPRHPGHSLRVRGTQLRH